MGEIFLFSFLNCGGTFFKYVERFIGIFIMFFVYGGTFFLGGGMFFLV